MAICGCDVLELPTGRELVVKREDRLRRLRVATYQRRWRFWESANERKHNGAGLACPLDRQWTVQAKGRVSWLRARQSFHPVVHR